MKANSLLIMSLAIGLHGCYEGTEFRPAPVGGWLEPVSQPPQARPAPQQSVPPHAAPMLQDPEAQTEQSIDYVWADSQAEAEEKCQREAERYSQEGGSLVTVVKVRKTGKGTKYECTFNGEK